MTRRFDVTALGELLIDFTDSGLSPAGMQLFERNPGGAPANVLAALARFGHQTAFLGKVGADMHGDFLRDTLMTAGIDVRGLISDPEVFTTLAFVALDPGGERSFSFARKPGRTPVCAREELDCQRLRDTRVLHIGSLSMTREPVRSATVAAVHMARDAGAVISYDPNYRASLWPSQEAAEEQMRRLARQAGPDQAVGPGDGAVDRGARPPAGGPGPAAAGSRLRGRDPGAGGGPGSRR